MRNFTAVVEKDSEFIPVEVKLAREEVSRSLRTFIELYKPRRAFIVSYKGESGKQKVLDCTISIVNVFDLVQKLKFDA